MDLERFVYLNVLLVPAIVIGAYLYGGTVPMILFVLGVGYVTFALLISVAWTLSRAEASRDGS